MNMPNFTFTPNVNLNIICFCSVHRYRVRVWYISYQHHRVREGKMVRDVAYVVGVWKLDVKGHSQVALVMVLLVRIVVAVAIIADIRSSSYPT